MNHTPQSEQTGKSICNSHTVPGGAQSDHFLGPERIKVDPCGIEHMDDVRGRVVIAPAARPNLASHSPVMAGKQIAYNCVPRAKNVVCDKSQIHVVCFNKVPGAPQSIYTSSPNLGTLCEVTGALLTATTQALHHRRDPAIVPLHGTTTSLVAIGYSSVGHHAT